jgi:hypothetical protein
MPSQQGRALWVHSTRLYAEMLKESDGVGEVDKPVVWKGHMTKLFVSLNIPLPYYTPVLHLLEEMDCVKQKARGGGARESEWYLIRQPTPELFEKATHKTTTPTPQYQTRIEQLEGQLKDIREMLQGLDIPRAIADLQSQIDTLRREADLHGALGV